MSGGGSSHAGRRRPAADRRRASTDRVSSALVQLHAAASSVMAIPGARQELNWLLTGIRSRELREWFMDVFDEIVDARGNPLALERVQKRILKKYPFSDPEPDS